MDERTLLAAAEAGDLLDCGEGLVDADVLRRLCRHNATSIDPRGIRLRNAVVAGELDLSGICVPFPLSFDDCRFDAGLRLTGAELHSLTITHSTLPGILANGVRVHQDLDLSGSDIRGAYPSNASTTRQAAVWLCESDIGGRLLCVDTTIDAGDQRAIHADRMHVGGTIRFIHAFRARGEVRLLGAQVDGSIDLTGAHLEQPHGLALDIADTVIGGSVHLIRSRKSGHPVVLGRIDAGTARISGRLMLRDVELTGPTGTVEDPYWRRGQRNTALSAPRLHVGGEVSFEGACVISGRLDLSSSDLGNVVLEQDCRLVAPGEVALNLTSAELRASLTLEPGVSIDGSLYLGGAHVAGNLVMSRTTWHKPLDRKLIGAQGARIDGDVQLVGMHADQGQLRFRGATVGRTFDAANAQLHNPDGETLSLHQAVVRGSVRLVAGFTSNGYVVLSRSLIEGRLDLRGGRFECPAPSARNPTGHAVEAVATTVRGGMYLDWAAATPSVDFTGATTTILADDPTNWPERFAISGFSYDRFAEPAAVDAGLAWDWHRRATWLDRQTVFDTGPYEQVARVFRQHGYAHEAERILIAQRGRAALIRPAHPIPLWRMMLRSAWLPINRSFGYGYRPWRALWMLISLLLLVLVTVNAPATRDAMRASDAQGDVYAPTGIVVTTTSSSATPSTFADRADVAPRADSCGDGQVRCFDSFFFAVDTVVPLVSLDQRATWYPDLHAPWGRFMEIWLYIATIFGWVLSSVFVLSFSRLVRNT
jgi:hypothetical protein